MFKKTFAYRVKGWSFYGPEDTPPGGTGGGGDPPSTLPGGAGGGTGGGGSGGNNNPPPGKTFTQSDIDRFLADDRRKHQAKLAEQTKQLELLQQSSRLTQEEKDNLATQIEEIKNSALSKEQQMARDLEKKENALKTTTEALTKERDSWQQRYGTLLVTNEITKAASENKAFSLIQIEDMLLPRAKVVEKKDGDGKGTGKFEVLIRFDDTDPKTKQPVVLELSPDATVKRMKELPERYGNLFESGIQGGVGKTKTGGTAGEPDVSKMTPEEFREYRKTRKLS